MSFFSDKWRGIILCAVLAVPCWFLGKLVPVVGAPIFAILLGMLVALVWPVEAAFKSGVGFVSKKVLRWQLVSSLCRLSSARLQLRLLWPMCCIR